LKDEITPVDGHAVDNGIKADSTMEKLASLNPAFVRPHGTHTAANSSFLTDGAAATLIMSEQKALELGYTPKAYLHTWGFVAVDPWEEMLLGPAYSIAQMLSRAGLDMKDIGVWEIHEAFAGQVLSNLNALNSKTFAKENLKGGWTRGETVGEVPRDVLNTLGGSLSLGHPFGATGSRIANTAANRLVREDKELAMIAACADSGQSVGMILERYPQ
jgi:acetyl-CoA acyltransferase